MRQKHYEWNNTVELRKGLFKSYQNTMEVEAIFPARSWVIEIYLIKHFNQLNKI